MNEGVIWTASIVAVIFVVSVVCSIVYDYYGYKKGWWEKDE